MDSVDAFIAELSQRKCEPTVTNPYQGRNQRANLELYLRYMQKHHPRPLLLVGEAPGYRGCRITGIPFTSGVVFAKYPHPLLEYLKKRVALERYESENTASIVWEYLAASNETPLFWNAFPFHPHPDNDTRKNRAPTAAETLEGKNYLMNLVHIFQPRKIIGIGRKGADCAEKSFPERNIMRVRHPSFGGKREFVAGLEQFFSG